MKDALGFGLHEGARNKIYGCLKQKLETAYGYKWKT
jgi:hypothetical protein